MSKICWLQENIDLVQKAVFGTEIEPSDFCNDLRSLSLASDIIRLERWYFRAHNPTKAAKNVPNGSKTESLGNILSRRNDLPDRGGA